MSALDTDTRLVRPSPEPRGPVQIPDWRPIPRRSYVPRHLHVEDQETAVISAERIVELVRRPSPRPAPEPEPEPEPKADPQMRTLARLLSNLRSSARWRP
jgi:hypothetical protein